MMKRDLKADLKFCDRATQGPWRHEWNPDYSEVYAPGVDKPIILVGHDPYDAEFIVQAREGWPHAIERALELEEELTRCGNTLVELTIALKDDRKRADKAEALVRELVDALRGISEILDNATCRCRCGFCEYFKAQKIAEKSLAKYKEVLEDE